MGLEVIDVLETDPDHAMNANEVLIDILEDNRRRLHRLFDAIRDEGLAWQPEADANSIAVTVWHMARILDVFLTLQIRERDPQEQDWFRNGWAAQTGYDPRGLGWNGWGMLTGYSPAQVDGIPSMQRQQLLGYLDEVYDSTREYLLNTPGEKLQSPAPGFEGRYSIYQCIQMALLDNVRHLGEIFAIQARWDRTVKDGLFGK
jgi:hypothetical protein